MYIYIYTPTTTTTTTTTTTANSKNTNNHTQPHNMLGVPLAVLGGLLITICCYFIV